MLKIRARCAKGKRSMTFAKYTPEGQRHAGILLHISSLPSNGYIGDLGKNAYQMVHVLAEMGVSVWQTLPINMPHADNSPYQCISAFAGNTELISLELLVEQGLLDQNEVDVFYQGHIENKQLLLMQAYEKFIAHHDQTALIDFCAQESDWLDDYVLFVAIRTHHQQQSWHMWPDQFKHREKVALDAIRLTLAKEISVIQFSQYIFFSQWHAFKQYASSQDVSLFGDIPIFVAYDSAEVWAEPALFKLDAYKNMLVVAGVPPDYFSETGQRWGNPHYNWEAMAQDDYAWWVRRLAKQNALFDLVRIDHFRGLEAAWEIAVSEETAMNGQWVKAPGDALLNAIQTALPEIHLVAEDLGIITEEVDDLRLNYDMPGMKILQFAFGGDETNPYLPQHIEPNSVVYTGTHDNDTSLGWYKKGTEHEKSHFHRLIGQDNPNMPQALIEMALASNAYLAIVPLQDVLGLDEDARMNTPGTTVDNWQWRFEWPQLTQALMDTFKNAIKLREVTAHG